VALVGWRLADSPTAPGTRRTHLPAIVVALFKNHTIQWAIGIPIALVEAQGGSLPYLQGRS